MGSNPSAAETMIADQTMALRSPRRTLCAEAKRIVLPAGVYFPRSGLPSEERR